MKKGAMFGLDARIALAIFGSLSVISGAALYSAIRESQVTNLITSHNEVAKAVSAYFIDTGEFPHGIENQYMYLEKLLEDPGVRGWNGPYISAEKRDQRYLDIPQYGGTNLGVNYGKDTSWSTRIACTTLSAGETCALWTASQYYPISLVEAVDEKIDGEINASEGRVRHFCQSGDPARCTFYIRQSLDGRY